MLLYWIWFAQLSGISLWQKRNLLQHFSDAEEIYYTDRREISAIDTVTEEILVALENRDLHEAEEILSLCKAKDIRILPYGSWAYPQRLKNISDPPVVLYYKGILPDWDSQPFIGVVGTRKATAYGLQAAYQMGNQISASGGMVISGGAYGVDTKAMHGALEAERAVVCVLGCGADVIYPRTNRRLFSQVVQTGCLISEYPPGEPPLAWHFPRRNRIISGISHGIVVVEAPEKSGALNTAHHALEQGRDVYAVPANIGVAAGSGSNALLQQGAVAIVTGWDAVKNYAHLFPDRVHEPERISGLRREIPQTKVAQKPVIPENVQKKAIDNWEKCPYSVINDSKPDLTDEEQAVLALLSRNPEHSDAVAARSNLPEAKVQSILTKLTLKGLAAHHPGGRISIK